MVPVKFECTVRALRIDKPMTRLSWDKGEFITKEGKTIHKHLPSGEEFLYLAPPEDILASDWVIHGI